ncbi:translation initiation factor IF-2 [Haemophilus influenzae]|uniref:Translation initiation factor IF-2 n=1 Tax=Haemophilus influenzae TaxID=727 RepID=A0A2X1PZQ6_HAEIF|nr:translation initiation factor IF-2 [Haemophilus influenzae]
MPSLLALMFERIATARRVIESENIDLRYYSIIYELLNEIKAAMSGMLRA